jgi:hypothetical protein
MGRAKRNPSTSGVRTLGATSPTVVGDKDNTIEEATPFPLLRHQVATNKAGAVGEDFLSAQREFRSRPLC